GGGGAGAVVGEHFRAVVLAAADRAVGVGGADACAEEGDGVQVAVQVRPRGIHEAAAAVGIVQPPDAAVGDDDHSVEAVEGGGVVVGVGAGIHTKGAADRPIGGRPDTAGVVGGTDEAAGAIPRTAHVNGAVAGVGRVKGDHEVVAALPGQEISR